MLDCLLTYATVISTMSTTFLFSEKNFFSLYDNFRFKLDCGERMHITTSAGIIVIAYGKFSNQN